MNRLRVTFRNGQRTVIETDINAHEMFEQISMMEWAAAANDTTAFRCDDVILIETVETTDVTADVKIANDQFFGAGGAESFTLMGRG